MGDCIPVRPWKESLDECLAEVRMIWKDKNEQSPLLSLRLYFLPENTPKGRVGHGEVSSEFIDIDKGMFIKPACILFHFRLASSLQKPSHSRASTISKTLKATFDSREVP